MSINVSIIGIGLIGGSIALSIKKIHKQACITGYDISQLQLEKAKDIGIIDKISHVFFEACQDANLIIFATPVEETKKLLTEISTFNIKSTVILTDVGSTKKIIVDHADLLFNSENGPIFIGGHPMAGSHKTGVESAKSHLFENAYYILTPTKNASEKNIEDLKFWLSGTGSHFVTMTPEEHDYATAVVSHFPHLIACGLVRHVEKYSKDMPIISELAAGGFKDITRIASSDPKMRSDIVSQNIDNLENILKDWKNTMLDLESSIKESAFSYFSDIKKYRDNVPENKMGAIKAYHDINVDIEDQPGVLAKVFAILEDISITNMEIREIREGLTGVLHIMFSNENDRIKAKNLLTKNGYKVEIL